VDAAVTARSTLDALLRWSPAQTVFGWRAGGHLAVLAYHSIEDADRFESHLDLLRRRFHPVSLDEVLAARDGQGGLPGRAVLVTFDDADRTHLEVALPLLRERGIPGVAFVVTGLLDSERPIWTTEVAELARRAGGQDGEAPEDLVRRLKRVPNQERLDTVEGLRRMAGGSWPRVPQLRSSELILLEAAGVAIGSHTHTHPCLPMCGDEAVRSEIETAHRLIADAAGRAPVAFAYPNGDWDGRAARLLADLGYRAGFLFDHRLSGTAGGNPLLMSRLRVDSTTTLDRLRIILSGLHPAIHGARRSMWRTGRDTGRLPPRRAIG
jgi:peptidoglycan/xylan/chitin deacetylase (PgdA/CDA1 family)